MKKFSLFFLLFIFTVIINAQQVYFCQNITDKGEPLNTTMELNIRPGGDYIYILLENDVSLESIIYLFIDKKGAEQYDPYDSKIIRNSDLDTWVKFNYKFISPGEYKASFMDKDRNLIAEGKLKVNLAGTTAAAITEVSKSFYDNTKVFFCERVIAEKPLNIKSSTNINENEGLIYLYLKSDQPLGTRLILVDVWRKKPGTRDYDEFIESKKFKVRKDWDYTFFKFYLKSPGDYKFMIYSENEKTINSAYLTATN